MYVETVGSSGSSVVGRVPRVPARGRRGAAQDAGGPQRLADPGAELVGGLGGEGQPQHLLRARPARWPPARPPGPPSPWSCPTRRRRSPPAGASGAVTAANCWSLSGYAAPIRRTQGLGGLDPHDSTVPAALVGQIAWNWQWSQCLPGRRVEDLARATSRGRASAAPRRPRCRRRRAPAGPAAGPWRRWPAPCAAGRARRRPARRAPRRGRRPGRRPRRAGRRAGRGRAGGCRAGPCRWAGTSRSSGR